MKNKYENGKIYTIRSFQTDKFYIGSTTSNLKKRLAEHRKTLRQFEAKKIKKGCSSYNIVCFEDAYIELLEYCACNTKDELQKREGELIQEHKEKCVNIAIPQRTRAEYYNDNLDKINKKSKEWQKKNPEKVKKYYKKWYYSNLDKEKERWRRYYNKNSKIINLKTKLKRRMNRIAKIKNEFDNSYNEILKQNEQIKLWSKQFLI